MPLALDVGDAAQPLARARAKGFGLNRERTGPGKPFVVRRMHRSWRYSDRCKGCDRKIEDGELFAVKEPISPLGACCLEPWTGGGYGE